MKHLLIFACTICISIITMSQNVYLEKRIEHFKTNTPAGMMDTCMSYDNKKLYVFWENVEAIGFPKLASYNITVTIWNLNHAPISYSDKIYPFNSFFKINPNLANIWQDKKKKDKEKYIVEVLYWIKNDSALSAKTLDVIPKNLPQTFKFEALF